MNARSIYRQLTRQPMSPGSSRRRWDLIVPVEIFEPLPASYTALREPLPPTWTDNPDGTATIIQYGPDSSNEASESAEGVYGLIDRGEGLEVSLQQFIILSFQQ